MKYIIAVIQPHRLDAVREALAAIGVQGLTVSEVRGFGRQKGQTEIYRGAEYTMHYVPKVKLEIAVDDALADRVVETIGDARAPAGSATARCSCSTSKAPCACAPARWAPMRSDRARAAPVNFRDYLNAVFRAPAGRALPSTAVVRNFTKWFFDSPAQFRSGRRLEIFRREIRQRRSCCICTPSRSS